MVIDKDSAMSNGRYRKGFNEFAVREIVNCRQHVGGKATSAVQTMIDIDSLEIKDRERMGKEIAKTSEAIRKKHQALKTGKMEEDIALER